MSMQNQEERNYDTVLEGLLDFMRNIPQPQLKMINLPRYKLMLKTAAQLTEMLKKATPNGTIDVDVDPVFNLGSVTVELDDLSVTNPLAFANIICKADNFEIYPLTNGKIRFDITFHSVLKTIK